MIVDRPQRVEKHLSQLDNLDAARRLLADLNYDVTRDNPTRHGWPSAADHALEEITRSGRF